MLFWKNIFAKYANKTIKRGVFVTKITINDVAAALKVSPQSIRLGLQRGELPFGSAVKTSSKYTYIIYEKKLKEFLDL